MTQPKTETDELIEMMVKSAHKQMQEFVPSEHQVARLMLSVIRKNVHMVAKVCPICLGMKSEDNDPNGQVDCECINGVIAKEEA